MNQINDLPPDYGAGLEFNYAVWTADTVLTLCNVPWSSDYRDGVPFESEEALNVYINSLSTASATIQNSRYAPLNQPVRIELPLNVAMRYNYIRADNPAMPISGDVKRTYYYFIEDVRYVNPSVTELVVNLDVFQMLVYDVEFGRCFVERSHLGIAAENAFASNGDTYLSQPENLELGGEMITVAGRDHVILRESNSTGGIPPLQRACYLVVMALQPFVGTGTREEPNQIVVSGGNVSGIPTGLAYLIFEGSTALERFTSVLTTKPWIAQSVLGAYMIPNVLRYHKGAQWGSIQGAANRMISIGVAIGGGDTPSGTASGSIGSANPESSAWTMFEDWRNSSEILNAIPARFRHLRKFFTYPYMSIDFTNNAGQRRTLRPELWSNQGAQISERGSIFPGGQRVTCWPIYYGRGTWAGSPQNPQDDGGEFLDGSVSIDHFPQIPVASDTGAAMLAANARGLQQAESAAIWARDLAQNSAFTGYAQAGSAINAANQQTSQGNAFNQQTTAYNNQMNSRQAGVNALANLGQGTMMGAVGGLPGMGIGAVGGVASGAMSMLNTSMDNERASQLANMAAGNSSAMNRISGAHASMIQGSNLDLALFAARGNYESTIAGINAQKQDMKIAVPGVAGRVGGEVENVLNNSMMFSLRWRMINRGAIRRIGEFWLRYGYAMNVPYTPNSLHLMTKFTYWKMAECNIRTSHVPEALKNAFRGIFEKGITIWRNPQDVNNIDPADNEPLAGITL